MDYIYNLKKLNISFKKIDELEAISIMRTRFSYYKLLSYTCLFDKYINGEKKGLFVNVDFSQLYCIAQIDAILGHIFMCMCLEIEENLKAKIIYEAESVCNTNVLFDEYYNSDFKYIKNNYTSENNDTIQREVKLPKDMSLVEFLDVAQFGTLERFAHYFYSRYAIDLYNSCLAPFESRLSSVRRIRNIVAHNNSIINKLTIKTEYKDYKMLSFLGKQGIKNRTLQTNMSKLIISDLCCFFDVYFNLVNKSNIHDTFRSFDENYGEIVRKNFANNDLINTSYNFMKKVIIIYLNNYKNNLTNTF